MPRFRSHLAFAAAIVVAGLLSNRPVAAAAPATIHEGGRIIDTATQQPISGLRNVSFRLYVGEDAPGGTEIWSEVHPLVFTDGVFSVDLGAQSPSKPR